MKSISSSGIFLRLRNTSCCKRVYKQQRLSKDEKLVLWFERILAVADTFETQLKRSGVRTGVWTRTREQVRLVIEALATTGGKLPSEDPHPDDEELVVFLSVCNETPTLLPTIFAAPNVAPINPPLLDDAFVSESRDLDERFDFGNDDGGFDPFVDEPLDLEVSTQVETNQAKSVVLDEEDPWKSPEMVEDQGEQKGKRKLNDVDDFDYGRYGCYASDEDILDSERNKSSEIPRQDDPGPSRPNSNVRNHDPYQEKSGLEIRPARKEMVPYFKSLGSNDDATASFVNTHSYKFIYPKRFHNRDSKKRMDTDPKHEQDFEWIQDAIYDVARELLFRRNRYEDAQREPAWDREWADFEVKVLVAWETHHLKRWGDRDRWRYQEACLDNHVLPRFFAFPEALKELEIRYFTESGTAVEAIKPYERAHRPSGIPIAFDPYCRLHVRTKNKTLVWIHPNEVCTARNYFLDHPNDAAFWDFGRIQSQNHPVHRATLVRVDNIGKVLAGLFRFLAFYRINFVNGEGVLFRQDARILWSQTSEAWKQELPTFRPPTLIFRIGFFHFAWWEARYARGLNIQGTARMYCLEADRWVGDFGRFLSTDHTKRNQKKKWD
jgi:hypothetical protein